MDNTFKIGNHSKVNMYASEYIYSIASDNQSVPIIITLDHQASPEELMMMCSVILNQVNQISNLINNKDSLIPTISRELNVNDVDIEEYNKNILKEMQKDITELIKEHTFDFSPVTKKSSEIVFENYSNTYIDNQLDRLHSKLNMIKSVLANIENQSETFSYQYRQGYINNKEVFSSFYIKIYIHNGSLNIIHNESNDLVPKYLLIY